MSHPLHLALRDYQHEAIQALEADWAAGITRCGIVLPTGAGKTVIFAHIAAHRHLGLHTKKTLVLVHRDELAQQAAQKFSDVAPELEVGVVKAARNEVDAEIIVASVQTLARQRRRDQLTGIDLIIVDECHHAGARTYQDILRHYGAFDADNPTLTAGFTATMARNDDVSLGDTWQKISYTLDILDLISAGHLVDVTARSVTVGGLDLSNVTYRRGDYSEGSLGAELIRAGAGEAIAAAYLAHAPTRPGVVFTPTVASAQHTAGAMTSAGIPTAAVWGDMPADERAHVLDRYRQGDIQVLANCMVLTEGWDAPWASCAVIARPTTSKSLYVQMVGRVLRTFPGKTDALVLDVVGITGRHKLSTIADLSPRIKRPPGDQDPRPLSELPSDVQYEKEAQLVSGALAAEDADLFDTSPVAWLSTTGGVKFVPLADGETVFLWPDGAESHWVGLIRTHVADPQPTWLHQAPTLSEARRHAERRARDLSPGLAARQAPWRKAAAPPTPAQLRLAKRFRLPHIEGETRAHISTRISVAEASRVLDRTPATALH